METISKDLLAPKGEVEQTVNYNRIAHRLNKLEARQYFLAKLPGKAMTYPGEMYNYHGNAEIPLAVGDVTVAASRYTASNTYDVTLTVSGTASHMTDAVKAALGFSSQTHVVIALVEMPTSEVGEVTYNSAALSEGDIVVIDDRAYLIVVKGVYASGGAITSAATNFSVTWNGVTVKYYWDFSELELCT